MQVWRICKTRWAQAAFDGEGARRAGGRWNHKGTAVIYTSTSLALASLELFVHLDPDNVPDDLSAIDLVIPDSASSRSLQISDLPASWRDYPAPAELKNLGTAWIQSGETLLLIVPSVVVPRERNVLINPAHPQFEECVVGSAEPFHFDPRMWK